MYAILLILIASIIIAVLGRKCRFGFWGMLFANLLFTPVVGILLLLVMAPQQPSRVAPPKKAEPSN